MANGKASDLQFRYQRPAAGLYRVGPSGSQMLFTSIQAAINQAVLDGFTSSLTPATIEIYPGTYVEDVTLSPGVHLRGVGSGLRTTNEVEIDGTVTYAPLVGTINDNVVNIDTIAIHPTTASKQALIFSGTAPARLNLRKCAIQSASAAGGTTGLVAVSNSGAGSTCRFTDVAVQAVLTTDTEIFQLSGSCTTEIYGGQGGLANQSGGTIATGISIGGSATLNIRIPSFVGGAFTQIFSLTSATATINADKTIIQNTLAGGHIFNATATGTIRCRHCGLFTANLAGKICNAAVAVNLQLQSCSFAGTQTAPNAQIDTAVNSFGNGTYNSEQDQIYKEFQVGRGIGYQTIQAAITAAAATGAGQRKVVKIPAGTYGENLTLAENVDLVADTFSDMPTENNSVVTISGVHSLALATGSVRIKGIRFSSTGNGSSLFTLSGAGGGQLRFENCNLGKSFVGTANLLTSTNSGGASVIFDKCQLSLSVNDGSMIDLSGASGGPQVTIQGQIAPTANFSPSIAINGATTTPALLYTGAAGGSSLYLIYARVSATTPRLFQINGNDTVDIDHCHIEQYFTVEPEGEMLRFSANSFSIFIQESSISQFTNPSPNGLPCLARDNGTQASATITVASNPSDGDVVTINGTEFTARVVPTQADEFAIGASTTDTATNLRNAVNSSTNTGDETNSGTFSNVYATSSANVVTLKAFGDSVGNAYPLTSSVPLVLVPSGATFAGGVDGVGGSIQSGENSYRGQLAGNPNNGAGAVVASPVQNFIYASSQVNQPTKDALIVQDEGVQLEVLGQPVTSQILNFLGGGVSVLPDVGNSRKANITIPGAANLGEFIVGTNPGDYATIQDALDAANAVGVTPYRRVVLVSPGSYVEDLVLYDNVDLAARTFADHALNVAPVNIVGVHSWTPAGSGSTIVCTGLHFGLTSGSFEIVANAQNQNSIQFHNCNLIKQLDEVDPMFLVSNVNGAQLYFQHCTVTHITDSGATFDIADGSFLFWYGTNIGGNNYDMVLAQATAIPQSAANLIKLGVASRAFIKFARMGANVETMFEADASAVMEMEYCDVIQNVDDGQMWKLLGAGALLTSYHNVIQQSNSAGDAPLLIRDGDQAGSFVTVASVPTAGDTLTINGTVFTAVNGAPGANQFQVDGGATVNDVANNIRDAINNSVSAPIDEVVYARSATNVVTLKARESGVAGNTITIESSVPDVMVLPGATVTVSIVPTAGDTLTINGVVFTAVNGAAGPDQFQVDGGATINDVATNIAAAVNTSVSVGVAGVVAASSLANVVSLTVITGIEVAVSTSVPATLVLSGITFEGGTAGFGGTWIVSLNVFLGVVDYMGSVTASLPPVTPTAV